MTEEEGPLKNEKIDEEEPKEAARAMLIYGYDRDDIFDEIKEVTGLSKGKIFKIKMALAISGEIPTKAELRRRERPGHEETFPEEQEGVPFRRSQPSHVLIEGILAQFGVKERAKEIIISRCKRAGGMHPSELERALMDLDSGVNMKEASYVTEEYCLALQAEKEANRQAEGGAWTMQRHEPEPRGGYGGGYLGMGGPQTGYRHDVDRGPRERPPETKREESLTMRDVMDILERRERNRDKRIRMEREKEKVERLGRDMRLLATEIKNLKQQRARAQTRT